MNDAHEPIEFYRDNDGFYTWLEKHPGGFFINNARPRKSTELFLHCSPCPLHYPNTPGNDYTNTPKLCSLDRTTLERWATGTEGRSLNVCPHCFH